MEAVGPAIGASSTLIDKSVRAYEIDSTAKDFGNDSAQTAAQLLIEEQRLI